VTGLEQGPFSLVSTIEKLLERKSSYSWLEIREYGRSDPSRWPLDTLYLQMLALTSLTSGCRSVGIVRSRAQATEFVLFRCLLSRRLEGNLLEIWISSFLFSVPTYITETILLWNIKGIKPIKMPNKLHQEFWKENAFVLGSSTWEQDSSRQAVLLSREIVFDKRCH
jgi:hypothetical protein